MVQPVHQVYLKNARGEREEHRVERVQIVCLRKGVNPRCLIVFAAREHDDIGWRALGSQRAAVCLLAGGKLLPEAIGSAENATHISSAVGRDGLDETLASILGCVRILDDTRC